MITVSILFICLGLALMGLAFEFALVRPIRRRAVLSRDATNFVGDVESWLRSEEMNM